MPDLDVREKVKLLPHQPGVYQFFDSEGVIIYIGKAKDLRNRVGSYFNKLKFETGKTAKLVSKITDLKVIVVETEFDALLLENSLIKQHQPRYNVALKDDKSYPWIRIRNERFPRVEGMRNPVDDGSEYYGPYASGRVMKTVVELVNSMYKLRTCNYELSQKNVERGKYKRCLEYHMGNCKAPCEGLQSVEEYDTNIKQIRQIVRGRTRGVAKLLKEQMLVLSDSLEFEKAEVVRQRIEQLDRYQARNTIVHADIGDVDVFALAHDAGGACVNYLRVIDGAVVHGITVELKPKLEETQAELLQLAIVELRERFKSTAPEAIVPFDPGIEMPGIVFNVAQRGDKKALLDLSERNARYFLLDKRKQEKLVDPEAMRLVAHVLDHLQAAAALVDVEWYWILREVELLQAFGDTYQRHFTPKPESIEDVHRGMQLTFTTINHHQLWQWLVLTDEPCVASFHGLFHARKIIRSLHRADIEVAVLLFARLGVLEDHASAHRIGALGVAVVEAFDVAR